MGNDKRKAKLTVIAVMIASCGALLGNHYLFINHEYTYFESETTRWLLPVMVFLIGAMARICLNVLLEQKLHVSEDVFYFLGKPHILLSNFMYAELIDIKVSFELINYGKSGRKTSSIVRVKQVETTSLSSVHARVGKAEPSRTYIEFPYKILDRWRGEDAGDPSVLVVRATSVSSVSNFRAVTNAAVFENLDAFGEARNQKMICVPTGVTT